MARIEGLSGEYCPVCSHPLTGGDGCLGCGWVPRVSALRYRPAVELVESVEPRGADAAGSGETWAMRWVGSGSLVAGGVALGSALVIALLGYTAAAFATAAGALSTLAFGQLLLSSAFTRESVARIERELKGR